MENESETRLSLYQKVLDVAKYTKQPHMVLFSTESERFKVENLMNVYIDRDAALEKRTRVLFVGFPSSFYTYEQLKDIVRVQLGDKNAEGISV